MKPTKNRFYCHACGRSKMLFETERQALNYIRFNYNEVCESAGYAPVRAYYCNVCMGWHVTSNGNSEHFNRWKSKAEVAVDSYIHQNEAIQINNKSRLFNRGMEFNGRGEYFKAADSFLQAFHAHKDMSATEQSPQCLESLREAFASACREVTTIIEKESYDKDDLKRCSSLITCLAKAAGFFPGVFDEPLSVLTNARERVEKRIVKVVPKLTPEEMEAVKDAKKKSKEMHKTTKRRKMVNEMLWDLSRIHFYILAGQRYESERLLHVVTAKIRELIKYDEVKEDALNHIDRVLELRNEFLATFQPSVSTI